VTVPQEWTDACHRLKFVFGEYCLYSAWFEAVELATHVTRFEGRLDETAAAAAPLLRRRGAVAIPSYPISAEPVRLKITRNYLRYVPAVTIHYFIEPGTSPSEYLGRMPRKYRHELLRKRRRFTERSGGEVDLRCYRTRAEAEVFYPLACGVSRKTYQRNLLDVALPETAEFEAELRRQAERDAMRGYLLFFRGTAIAYAYGTACGDYLGFRCIGHDPAFADLSPGIVLISQALGSVIGEARFALIDFGSGEAQYKRIFATGSVRCATVLLFRPTLRHLAMVAAHVACTAASDGCASLLGRFGFKEHVKRYFRTRSGMPPPRSPSRT
jgi:CelD/BcsL family acetyltransferase involved in cellulose biosynthesis